MKLTKENYLSALHVKNALQPAIDSLNQIDVEAVGSDSHKKIITFVDWLNGIASDADKVIFESNEQYDNRPVNMINKITGRFMEIPSLIAQENLALSGCQALHDTKVSELKQKNFTSLEIANILPDPQSQIDVHLKNIAELENEQSKLGLFINDAPMFDTSILEGLEIGYINLGETKPLENQQPTWEGLRR